MFFVAPRSPFTRHCVFEGGVLERNGRKATLVVEPSERWTARLASEFYDVASWGKGYFSVGDNGHVFVHPEKEPGRSIDLKQLVDTLMLRGIRQ